MSLIVGDAQGILDQQLRPRPVHVFNITIILISYNIIHFILFNSCIILKNNEDYPNKIQRPYVLLIRHEIFLFNYVEFNGFCSHPYDTVQDQYSEHFIFIKTYEKNSYIS